MIQLKCPSCSAPFDVPDDSGMTVACSYCGTTFLRGATRSREEPGSRIALPLVIVGTAVLLIIAGMGAAVWMAASRATTRKEPDQPAPRVATPPRETPSSPSMAEQVLVFGSEGTGPGQFDDNRSVAVGPDGRIYSVDYTGGRLLVFDGSGRFLAQWSADEDSPVTGLVADREDRIYVAHPTGIEVIDTATGKRLATWDREWAQDIKLTADNQLIIANVDGDVVKLDRNGRETGRLTGLAEKASMKRSQLWRIAVDGHGNIVLGDQQSAILLRFTSDGRYVDRFSALENYKRMGLGYINAIAIDGKDRVLVSTSDGIKVFSSEGNLLGVIPVRQAFGIVLNDAGELFLAARPTVAKFRFNS